MKAASAGLFPGFSTGVGRRAPDRQAGRTEVALAQVLFSSWGRKIVDNRKGAEGGDAALRLPSTFDGERPLAAFMGWDGLIVFDPQVDIPAMVAEYMHRVQTLYCCAKCTPGKKGTKILDDLLAAVL